MTMETDSCVLVFGNTDNRFLAVSEILTRYVEVKEVTCMHIYGPVYTIHVSMINVTMLLFAYYLVVFFLLCNFLLGKEHIQVLPQLHLE